MVLIARHAKQLPNTSVEVNVWLLALQVTIVIHLPIVISAIQTAPHVQVHQHLA